MGSKNEIKMTVDWKPVDEKDLKIKPKVYGSYSGHENFPSIKCEKIGNQILINMDDISLEAL